MGSFRTTTSPMPMARRPEGSLQMGLRTHGGNLPVRTPLSSVNSMLGQRSASQGMNFCNISLLRWRCCCGVFTSCQQSIGPPGTPSKTIISHGPLTVNGPCEIMVFEGVPGGPMDCWQDVKTPQQHLQRSKEILQKFMPWEAERCPKIELTDDNGVLTGRFPPCVRKPICKLPSGRLAMGMGDVVVLNDPITGQGSNTACKCAKIYLDRILEQGKKPFDADWMQKTFNEFARYADWVVKWTNSLLTPPPPHVLGLMGAASQIPKLAGMISNGFDHPPDYNPWWFSAEEADALIKKLQPGQ